MKKLLKNSYLELLIIALIALLSFVSFNYFFSSTESGSYYQNIISALMGTLFTIVITAFLLKQQAKSDEVKEQNVEVFKKKVEKYEHLITLLTDATEDKEITRQEILQIKKSIYEISLFCSQETLELVGDFFKQEIIGNFDDNEKISIFDITSKMRKELHLEGIDSFENNALKPVDFVIESEFDLIPTYKSIYTFLFELREKIAEIVFESKKNYEVSAIENLGNTIQFFIKQDDSHELDIYPIEIELPKSQTPEVALNFRVMKWSGNFHWNKHEHLIQDASMVEGMEYILDDDFPSEISGQKSLTLKVNSEHKIQEDIMSLTQSILSDIEFTENSFNEKS